MRAAARVVAHQDVGAGVEHVDEPLVPVPEILRHVGIDVLDRGLLAVREGATADGGEDDGFGEGAEVVRGRGWGSRGDGFREEAHLEVLG